MIPQAILGIPSKSSGLQCLLSDKDVSCLSARSGSLSAGRVLRFVSIPTDDQRAFRTRCQVSEEVVTIDSSQLTGLLCGHTQFLSTLLQVTLV